MQIPLQSTMNRADAVLPTLFLSLAMISACADASALLSAHVRPTLRLKLSAGEQIATPSYSLPLGIRMIALVSPPRGLYA